jgi:hypothetical protein
MPSVFEIQHYSWILQQKLFPRQLSWKIPNEKYILGRQMDIGKNASNTQVVLSCLSTICIIMIKKYLPEYIISDLVSKLI